MDEWMKKMWQIHTLEYYSTFNKRKLYHLWQHGWNEDIMTSEISQTWKDKYCMMSATCGIYKVELIKERVDDVYHGLGGGENGKMLVQEKKKFSYAEWINSGCNEQHNDNSL